MGIVKTIDHAIAASPVGWYFRLDDSGHPAAWKESRFSTEIRAGITTFFTMAYIIAANASILSMTGGPCAEGHDQEEKEYFSSDEYTLCVLTVQQDMVTATAGIAALGSFFMGLLSNLPVAIAPGMGLNAYFAYQVVGVNGSGRVPYSMALTAVFVEGFIFIGLSLLGLRQWLAQIIPASIKIACGAGIGLFLTLVGLGTNTGIGAISGSADTPLTLGGCPPQYMDENGACKSHLIENPTMWIGFLCGGILTAFLMMYRVKSSILIGIAVVSIISWPRPTNFTYFPYTVEGNARFDYFKHVVDFHPIQKTLNVLEWDLTGVGSQFAIAIITLLYVDILDCTGTLYSMARFAGAVSPVTGDFERSTIAYCTDAATISIGALLGVSPSVAFIESGAGIAEGGRTGITSMTTGMCFFISLFFAPVFSSIPPWATGGALCLVGCMMMRGTLSINWRYPGDAIPAFVTLAFIPFSYSIAYGLIVGLITYACLNGMAWILKKISFGRILPDDEDSREYWSYKAEITHSPPWFVRAFRGEKKFWKKDDDVAIELESTLSGIPPSKGIHG